MQILFIDDCASYCDGVSLLIENLFPGVLITKCNSAPNAFIELENQNFDIAICDLQLQPEDVQGYHIVNYIRKERPNIRVIILTNIMGSATVLALYRLGINGFLFKNATREIFKECINTVMNEQDYLQQEVRTIVKNLSRVVIPSILMTKEEVDVLRHLSAGLTAKEIAVEMEMPERTVRYNRDKLLAKTQTKNIAELVHYSMTNTLVVSDNLLPL